MYDFQEPTISKYALKPAQISNLIFTDLVEVIAIMIMLNMLSVHFTCIHMNVIFEVAVVIRSVNEEWRNS